VSVLYSQQVAGINEDVAERQLSVYYGHIAIPYLSGTYAMDKSWKGLDRYFGIQG
jgi:hypothetical protein